MSLLLGNLDVECEWARPAFTLPEAVLERISGAATLLRVFATDGDQLWTPRPVDAARVAAVDGLPTPRLISGVPPAEADWEWGQRSSLAARLNHRGWIRDLRSVEEIRSIGGFEGRWILKNPFGAAGRGHLRGEGSPNAEQRRAIERRLERFGSLIREPWIDRAADFGCAAWVEGGEVRIVGVHRLHVDSRGRFLGIRVDEQGLLAEEESEFREMAMRVGSRLHAAGYAGAFGIDACRSVSGEFHPLLEANVRFTFGHVAWELARLLGATALEFGDEIPAGGTALLHPGDLAAWIRK